LTRVPVEQQRKIGVTNPLKRLTVMNCIEIAASGGRLVISVLPDRHGPSRRTPACGLRLSPASRPFRSPARRGVPLLFSPLFCLGGTFVRLSRTQFGVQSRIARRFFGRVGSRLRIGTELFKLRPTGSGRLIREAPATTSE
jgi:hypothetical protein